MKDVLLFILCLSTVLLSSCGSDNEDVAKSTDNTGGEDNSEYVDLGLSVKWATCNLGSSKPEDAGDYYAWGEVAPKSSYYWSNYQWCKDTLTNYTKYCSNSSLGDNGFTDDKVLLDTSDDAATQKLGSPWRMPTVAECRELLKNCDWKMTDLNGVTGFLFVSKKNGKSIFLPSSGEKDGSELHFGGRIGCYWTSSLDTDEADYNGNVGYNAWGLYSDSKTNDNAMAFYTECRYRGFTIRPVRP